MKSSIFKLHLIDTLTTNESLFFSVLLENQESDNVLQSVYMFLSPFISRVSLNKIKKNLVAKGFISKDFRPLLDPNTLSEPLRSDMIHTKMGRPSNK